MEGIIIVLLFSLQLVSLFLIVILFAKLNKYKGLEKKQEQIVGEMDAALGAYLMEMKEENDRLIRELSTIPKPILNEGNIEPKLNVPITQQVISKIVSPTTASNVYKANIEKQMQYEEQAILNEIPPVHTEATNERESIDALAVQRGRAGQQDLSEQVLANNLLQVKELSYEEMIVEMYNDGQSIEEIAKKLNKGKTEIELLIKFHT